MSIYIPTHLEPQPVVLKKLNALIKTTIDNTAITTNSPYGAILSFTSLRSAKNLKFKIPTIIQKYAIPVIKQKHPLLCRAPTGMGKTLCFLLPLIDNLLYAQGLNICIICPTRELCEQTRKVAVDIVNKQVRVEVICGGIKSPRDLQSVNIAVCTPGRLIDLLDKESINFSVLNAFVLDEADVLLSMGFKNELMKIRNFMDSNVPTFLFSATFTDEMNEIVEKFLPANRCIVEIEKETTETIKQEFHLVKDKDAKQRTLKQILDSLDLSFNWNKNIKNDKVIVFVETKANADSLYEVIKGWKYSPGVIHGDKDQVERFQALGGLNSGTSSILVATSVAARGIDIPSINYVVNYDFPRDMKEYIHRIGRTGRQGNTGKSISFVTEYDLSPDMKLELINIIKESNNIVPPFITDYRPKKKPSNSDRNGRKTKDISFKNKNDKSAKSSHRGLTRSFSELNISSPNTESDEWTVEEPSNDPPRFVEKEDGEDDTIGHWD